MAAIYERDGARLTFRLNTGAHPVSGKPVMKTVGMAVKGSVTANNCAAVKAAVAPLLVHPTIETLLGANDVLGDDGN